MANRSAVARRSAGGDIGGHVAQDAQRPLARVEKGGDALRDLRVQRVEQVVRQREDAAPVAAAE